MSLDKQEIRKKLEKLLLYQAQQTIASQDYRSANKYEILPTIESLIKEALNKQLDELESKAVENVNGVKVLGVRHINEMREKI